MISFDLEQDLVSKVSSSFSSKNVSLFTKLAQFKLARSDKEKDDVARDDVAITNLND